MGAGLVFLTVENVFSFVVLLTDCVVAIDGDGAQGIAVCGDAVTEDEVVACVESEQEPHEREGDDDESAFHGVLDSFILGLSFRAERGICCLSRAAESRFLVAPLLE